MFLLIVPLKLSIPCAIFTNTKSLHVAFASRTGETKSADYAADSGKPS
jgi:hypothetical protein